MNGGKDIPSATHPKIRLFHIPKRQAGAPADNVSAAWNVCSPQTVPTFSGVAYYFGRHLVKKLGVPVGLINTSWGGSPIQPWTPPVGYDLVPEFKEKKIGNRGAPGMYNAMIHPLIPFAIRGAIWYQGESNVNDAATYHARMQALILGWRKAWGQDLSFYFVQLAPWTGYAGGMLPLQWEAQTATLSTPKTGMAVIHDTIGGAVGDIHPRNKHDVGKRLALWALAKDYGRKRLVCSGPLYKSMRVKGNKIILTFDHVGEGLKSRGDKPLDWFTIAGADKKFVRAKAKIARNRVVVVSEQVAKPVAVRFAWNKTARPNLMNKNGLPAGPFRTDRW
jgi:sialate O-acetylesterase